MQQLNINEVKTHLSGILAQVEKGETVVICRRNKPIAEIKPIEQKKLTKRPIGLAGKQYPDFKLNDEFFDPLPDDIMKYFTGEKE